MNTQQKKQALITLALKRRSERLDGYKTLSDIFSGFYDYDGPTDLLPEGMPFVSPWTRSACNLEAQVMLVGQDWASDEYLLKQQNSDYRLLGQDPTLPTNMNLSRLLADYLGLKFGDTYATNLFPFIKTGNISKRIPMRHLRYCARRYLLPQIEIVKPALVICFGSDTYNAVRLEVGLKPLALARALTPSGVISHGKASVLGVHHPGGLGLANAGGWSGIRAEWEFIKGHAPKLIQSAVSARKAL